MPGELKSHAEVARPLARELGTALDWMALMGLAVRHGGRAYHYGYRTVESRQFQSSLALGRIPEDPPVPGALAGTVRMIVPGAYGSPIKTQARFVNAPAKIPAVPRQIDPATGQPHVWPIRDTIVHWAALLPALAPGNYNLRCRTIDANGIAQPMPRPLPRTGVNAIQQAALLVEV